MKKAMAILAVEDQLSEAVSRRILDVCGIEVSQVLGLRGKGYLEKSANGLNQAAKALPIFMLTDLDSPNQCPPGLVRAWIKGEKHSKFFLRVAVMEVESWIMADRAGLAQFLSIPVHRIPQDTDAIPYAKEFPVSLARLSRKTRLREDIVPQPGSTSKVGPLYNSSLAGFVSSSWNFRLAAHASVSLKRTLDRLRAFQNAPDPQDDTL
ncbi:MAG: hypothetical protein ACP5SH_05340 [Syntrophobacteraceae bacterium]